MRALEFFRRFQQGRCYLCDQTMLFKQHRGWRKNPLYATVDHVRPQSATATASTTTRCWPAAGATAGRATGHRPPVRSCF